MGGQVRVGSHQLVYGSRKPEEWAVRALRRAAWRSALSVFVSVDGRTIGTLLLADELRRGDTACRSGASDVRSDADRDADW